LCHTQCFAPICWWNWSQLSISSTFYEQLLHWYSCTKKLQSQTVIREKLSKALCMKKALKIFMKLIPSWWSPSQSKACRLLETHNHLLEQRYCFFKCRVYRFVMFKDICTFISLDFWLSTLRQSLFKFEKSISFCCIYCCCCCMYSKWPIVDWLNLLFEVWRDEKSELN